MSEQEVLMLAGMFKEISETVWDIALLRVYATSLQFSVWAILFFVAGTGTLFAAVRASKSQNRDTRDASPFVWIAMGACFIAFGGFLAAAIGRAAAPEWYALYEIMMHLR